MWERERCITPFENKSALLPHQHHHHHHQIHRFYMLLKILIGSLFVHLQYIILYERFYWTSFKFYILSQQTGATFKVSQIQILKVWIFGVNYFFVFIFKKNCKHSIFHRETKTDEIIPNSKSKWFLSAATMQTCKYVSVYETRCPSSIVLLSSYKNSAFQFHLFELHAIVFCSHRDSLSVYPSNAAFAALVNKQTKYMNTH